MTQAEGAGEGHKVRETERRRWARRAGGRACGDVVGLRTSHKGPAVHSKITKQPRALTTQGWSQGPGRTGQPHAAPQRPRRRCRPGTRTRSSILLHLLREPASHRGTDTE